MDMRWFLRASQWARNPPSQKRVMMVFGIIAICAALYGVEKFFGMPDWMKIERIRMGIRP
jgi:hypothetical protein